MEIWKQIVGYENCYDVSSFGNVRSWLPAGGTGRKRTKPILLTSHVMAGGYLAASLRGRSCLIHALVLEAFVGPRPGDPREIHACHFDGVTSNNHVDNLRWATVSENHADKLMHGTDFNGEKNPSVKLSRRQVDEIIERLRTFKHGDVTRLAKEFGVDQTTISDIKTGRTWAGAI